MFYINVGGQPIGRGLASFTFDAQVVVYCHFASDWHSGAWPVGARVHVLCVLG